MRPVPSPPTGSHLVQRGLWSRIRQAATSVGGGIANLIKRAVAGAKTAWNSAKGLAQRVGQGVKTVAQRALGAAKKAWAGAKESAGNLLTRVTQVAKGAWSTAKGVAAKFWGGAPGFMDKVEARARQVWVKGRAMIAKMWNRTKSTSSRLQNSAKVLWNRAIQGARNLWSRAKQGATSFWGRVRSFWRSAVSRARSYWNNVKSRARSLWSRARQGVNRLRQRIGQLWNRAKQLAQRAWARVAQGARAAWQGIGWFGRQLWSKLKGIYHRAINWGRLLPTRLKRLIDHLWDGVKSMKPWAISWWQSLGRASTWKGFAQWLGTSLIQLLEVVGVGEIYETVADFVKFNTRELTGAEKARARLIFGGGIDYNLVRVDDRALLGPAFTRREYVSFHIINGWGGIRDATLIHEMTHVWQYSNMGAIYMPKAIGAQASTEGYDYGGVPGLRRRQAAGQGLTSFNLEQQASIIEDYYTAKYENRIGRDPVPAANQSAILATYEHFARDVSA